MHYRGRQKWRMMPCRFEQVQASKLKSTGDRIHEQLGVLLNSHRSMLQDAIITMRNGRYCLPVKAEYRSSFHGMLHDQSATGATLFIDQIPLSN